MKTMPSFVNLGAEKNLLVCQVAASLTEGDITRLKEELTDISSRYLMVSPRLRISWVPISEDKEAKSK